MVNDDLVKRLRHLETRGSREWGVMDEAADRIEALTDDRDALAEACAKWAEVSQGNYQRAKAAEARVAELEGLVERAKLLIDPCYPKKHADWQNDARATLTKKGHTDE